MGILSIVAAVWMGFLSVLGFWHPQPTQNIQNTPASATTTQATVTPSSIAQSSAVTSAPSATSASQTSTGLPATGTPWQTALPLGDNKYVTSAPKQGYIYLCHVAAGGQGAQGNPTWISGNEWYPAQKVAVEGSVAWPNASYSMTISGSDRIIKSNGEPTDHDTGTFPISKSDPAYQFDANPNTIEAQNYDYSLPAYPSVAADPGCIYGEVGMLDDGIPIFDGFDAEYRDAVAHETQDAWDGHPDQTGVYHDHGFEDALMQGTPVSTVVGFAFDGFPITGGKLPDGTYLTTADLDECHGLTSTITLDGKQVTTYHYVLTQDFPYTVSCFRGTSYEPKPAGGGSMGGMQMGASSNQGPQGMPPPR